MEVDLTREESLAYYKQMVEVREMEMAARDLYLAKNIRGFLHVFVGQVCICGCCRISSWLSDTVLGQIILINQ